MSELTAAGERLVALWLSGRTHPPSQQRLADFRELVADCEATVRAESERQAADCKDAIAALDELVGIARRGMDARSTTIDGTRYYLTVSAKADGDALDRILTRLDRLANNSEPHPDVPSVATVEGER